VENLFFIWYHLVLIFQICAYFSLIPERRKRERKTPDPKVCAAAALSTLSFLPQLQSLPLWSISYSTGTGRNKRGQQSKFLL
jgi:hypothetical protein